MLETYITMACILLASITTITRIMLEHQRDKDRMDGIVQPDEIYTMKGMLKLMHAERMAKKLEERESKLSLKVKKNVSDEKKKVLRVQPFLPGKK